jgi:uncharacterized protein involved in exopolysaccharide biosynthesis
MGIDRGSATGEPGGPASDRNRDRIVNLPVYWRIIRKRRRFIGRFVLAVVILTAVATLMMKNIYQATAVISPISTKDNSSAISTLAQQFGGLPVASLLGAPTTATEIVNFLNSKILREKVIEKNNLLPVLFPDRWDKEKGRWKEGFFSGLDLNPLSLLGRLVDWIQPGQSEQRPTRAGVPDLWDGLRELGDIVRVRNDQKGNTITIVVNHPDAKTAAKIVEYFLTTLTDYMSSEARRVALVNRKYLEDQLNTTADPLIRQNIYNLIAQQIERSMTAEAKENFAFKVIDPPRVPDKKFRPRRMEIIAISTITGLLLAVLAVLFQEYRRGWKQHAKERENDDAAC